MALPRSASDLNVGLHSSHAFLFVQPGFPLFEFKCISSVCPMALKCIKYIAGSHLVICLRTVNGLPFKTNSWGRNSSSSFFTKSHFVILMAFTWVDPVSLPHIFCYDAEGSSRTPALPRLPQSESSRRPHLKPGARPKLHFRSSGNFSFFFL